MCMHQGNEGVNYFVGKGLLNYCHGMLACMQWLPGSLIVSPRLPPKKDIIVVIIMHACIIILCHLLLFTRAIPPSIHVRLGFWDLTTVLNFAIKQVVRFFLLTIP